MSRPYDLPDYRLDPPDDEYRCPHCDESGCWCDLEDADPFARPRTPEDIEDAEYDVHCAGCNRVLTDDEPDWNVDRCPECEEEMRCRRA